MENFKKIWQKFSEASFSKRMFYSVFFYSFNSSPDKKIIWNVIVFHKMPNFVAFGTMLKKTFLYTNLSFFLLKFYRKRYSKSVYYKPNN